MLLSAIIGVSERKGELPANYGKTVVLASLGADIPDRG